ncbi:hypothetical protein CPC08DRAFT_728823 [Agrocybe pediades]|nr:hypothetical protein CPC08DRAFT_728823 [Agrocybe pediades]
MPSFRSFYGTLITLGLNMLYAHIMGHCRMDSGMSRDPQTNFDEWLDVETSIHFRRYMHCKRRIELLRKTWAITRNGLPFALFSIGDTVRNSLFLCTTITSTFSWSVCGLILSCVFSISDPAFLERRIRQRWAQASRNPDAASEFWICLALPMSSLLWYDLPEQLRKRIDLMSKKVNYILRSDALGDCLLCYPKYPNKCDIPRVECSTHRMGSGPSFTIGNIHSSDISVIQVSTCLVMSLIDLLTEETQCGRIAVG